MSNTDGFINVVTDVKNGFIAYFVRFVYFLRSLKIPRLAAEIIFGDNSTNPTPPGKGVSMTTQFGDSLEIKGSTTDLSSLDRLSMTTEAKTVQSTTKRKRGRPRKAIPLDALDSARTGVLQIDHTSIREKASKIAVATRIRKNRPVNDPFEDEYFDLDTHGGETPFFEDELATLDEFEKLAKAAPKVKSQKRVDQASGPPAPVVIPRRKKVTRRRQIDPATCERDYDADELEFMNALSEYKRTSGRMFPTCSEILEVLKGLGYEKRG